MLTQVVGFIILTDPISSIDENVFSTVVPNLQANESLNELVRVLTQVGGIDLNIGLSLIIGLLAGIYHRNVLLGLIAPAVMLGSLAFQRATAAIIGREVPTELVIGDAGGYLSGGVLRLTILGLSLIHISEPTRPY